MTLLGYQDGASYLELAGLLVQQGTHVAQDLTGLWRRIVFNICVSNRAAANRASAPVLEHGLCG